MARHRVLVSLIGAVLLITLVPALVGATGRGLILHRQERAAFASGGLGLKLADWEAIHGPGQEGQTYKSYTLDDGVYNVGVDGTGGPVYFIERTWNDPAGVPLAQAQSEAKGLLPADAKWTEYYDAASVKILYGTDVDRYSSKSLATQVRGTNRNLTGYFAVLYEKIPAQATYGYNVTRLVLVIGTKNSNLG
jgi:hypothetical protein